MYYSWLDINRSRCRCRGRGRSRGRSRCRSRMYQCVTCSRYRYRYKIRYIKDIIYYCLWCCNIVYLTARYNICCYISGRYLNLVHFSYISFSLFLVIETTMRLVASRRDYHHSDYQVDQIVLPVLLNHRVLLNHWGFSLELPNAFYILYYPI